MSHHGESPLAKAPPLAGICDLFAFRGRRGVGVSLRVQRPHDVLDGVRRGPGGRLRPAGSRPRAPGGQAWMGSLPEAPAAAAGVTGQYPHPAPQLAGNRGS